MNVKPGDRAVLKNNKANLNCIFFVVERSPKSVEQQHGGARWFTICMWNKPLYFLGGHMLDSDLKPLPPITDNDIVMEQYQISSHHNTLRIPPLWTIKGGGRPKPEGKL